MTDMRTEQLLHTRSIQQRVAEQAIEKENRRLHRISLPLPVRVEVRVDASVTWNEITRLDDVSAFGAGFSLKRPIKRGRLVQMTMPLPRQLRCYDYSEPQYMIWALVRRCILVSRRSGDEYAIGVAFVGQKPPENFLKHPSRLYDILSKEDGSGFWQIAEATLEPDDSELPADLRKQSRYAIPETLRVLQIDDAGNVIFSEDTVTENISLGGAAVFTTLNVEPGTFIRVANDRTDVEILSIVRGSRQGPDGITRLHIEFIDRFFPLEGIV
jgi:hypothetical protein